MEFALSAPRKRGSSDQLPKAFFARFPSNSRLCLVETLCSYFISISDSSSISLFQCWSIVYPVYKASQTDYGTVHREVATLATQGSCCRHQCLQGTFRAWSLNYCSSQFQCSLIGDFKNVRLVYSFNFSEVLLQTRSQLNVCSCSSSMSLVSGVHSSWVAPLQCRSLDQRLDIADICLVYLYNKHCYSEVFPLLSDIKISTLVFVRLPSIGTPMF